MKSTPVLVCGFDNAQQLVFSANVKANGEVTVWASVDNEGMATVYDGENQTIDRFAGLVQALEDLAGYAANQGDPCSLTQYRAVSEVPSTPAAPGQPG